MSSTPRALKRLRKYHALKAKTIQNFPKIIIEPTGAELVRMLQQNMMESGSCRGIISETEGLIVFDSTQYTHASVAQVLENEYGIELPPKLDAAHQLTFISTKVLDFKSVFIFTSTRAYKNPIDELKKYSKMFKRLEKELKFYYVNFDQYDDARYLLSTVEDKDTLLKELRMAGVL